MDPFSIATSAAGVVTMCIQIGQTLYGFVSDTHALDYNMAALHNEILGLSHVLQAIEKKWKNQLIHDLRDGYEEELWLSVLASIDDCKSTLGKLESKLKEVEESNRILGRGFLRKPMVAAKLNLNMKDISAFKQRISSHNSAMQSALAMINFCLLLQNNSSHDSMARKLAEIQLSIIGIENALQAKESPEGLSSDMLEEDERISRNLAKLIKEAESFHSNASSIVGSERRSTRWAGSLPGERLSDEQLRQIQNWIPPPSGAANLHDDMFSSKSDIIEPGVDRDSDPGNNMLERFDAPSASDHNHADRRKGQVSLLKARSGSWAQSDSPLELKNGERVQASVSEATQALPNTDPEELQATQEQTAALDSALTSRTQVDPSTSPERPLQQEIIRAPFSTEHPVLQTSQRWETLSSHWDGLTHYWIRRMQEMNLSGLSAEQQLSRQVADLSAAGANLFHAIVELQRLRAASERKFQKWFSETREEHEKYQERIAQLEAELDEARKNQPPDQNSTENHVEVMKLAQRNAKQIVEERVAKLQHQTEEKIEAENKESE